MEANLRQRIIGAVVLVALAVIFLPLLFKSSSDTSAGTKPITLSAQIPPAPTKPTPAPQTIVMIKNKDLNTPAADASRAPIIQPNPLSSTNNTSNVLAANQQTTEINSDIPPATMKANTTKNINRIEDAALNPPDENNTTNTSTSKNAPVKAIHANARTVKPIKKHEKIKETKHITAESKLAKSSHQSINKAALAKKHHEITHYAKATKTTAMPEKTIHKKISTLKSSTTELASAQNAKTSAGVAWEVRLGSFANDSNVKDLVKQLRARGFKAYTQSIQSSFGGLTRVAIGPETKREKADVIQTRLAKELNIKSEVIPFSPATDNK